MAWTFLVSYENSVHPFPLFLNPFLEIVMPITEARFYISQIILAIEHLHSLNIVYRDHKPENLMIDEQGYLKLIDFGTSKLLQQNRTFTLMGSLNYIAPEILEGSGHSFEVDLFSIGIHNLN